MDSVKKEVDDTWEPPQTLVAADAPPPPSKEAVMIDLSSSDSDSDEDEGDGGRGRDPDKHGRPFKRARSAAADLPLGFLDPLPPEKPLPLPPPEPSTRPPVSRAVLRCKQFWKAGDVYESPNPNSTPLAATGIDHVRVHPKFLHSNATSHKWALGALAELLDNSLDEVCNGSTFVNIDMLINKKDGSKMLLIEDNGGGMDPDKMRQCMSLGYSAKCKIANTIGQYGNGFKTSTMRLGADAIVFSRSRGKEGKRTTQSIGMLSYTFLMNTGKEDIVVPMLDYKKDQSWNKLLRSSLADWTTNLETIIQWSPYSSEMDLLQQFGSIKEQGTRIVIYNLWEDDQGELELDFDADKHDIQIRGVNRDEKKIEMAKKYPNSRHFLTYRHSLRSYASILYLRLPHIFRMILRGKDIEHHNVVNDMMLKQEITYKPQSIPEGKQKDPDMVAVVTIGFVKDAKFHIDVQGFNVYHKNRLIKKLDVGHRAIVKFEGYHVTQPFWRVSNPASSDGRGVIGVLEANFIEPAHDKQGFERTTILSRLEVRLIQMQRTYWATNCHRIGYAPRISKKAIESDDQEDSPEQHSRRSSKGTPGSTTPYSIKTGDPNKVGLSNSSGKSGTGLKRTKFGKNASARSKSPGTHEARDDSESEREFSALDKVSRNSSLPKTSAAERTSGKNISHSTLSSPSHDVNNGTQEDHASNRVLGIERITRSHSKASTTYSHENDPGIGDAGIIKKLKDENEGLKKRIIKMEESPSQELQLEKERNKSLLEQLEAAQKKLEELNKEQEALIDIFSEERSRRDKEEDNLRKKLKEASQTIHNLLEKSAKCQNCHKS